jgi:hypothetical protein
MPARKVWKAARSVGSAAGVPVGSWDAIAKAVPSWVVTASPTGSRPCRAGHARQPGGCSADRDGLVGLRDRRARMCGADGPGGRSGIGRQILLRRCCDRPCLGPCLQEVNDCPGRPGAPFPVSLPCVACPPGRVCGQGLAMAVVAGCGPGSSDWLAQGPGPGTASVAGVVVRVRGRRTGRSSVGRWVSFRMPLRISYPGDL